MDTKTAMGETLRASAFALTEAKYAAGDFRHTVFDNVGTASVKVGTRPAATGYSCVSVWTPVNELARKVQSSFKGPARFGLHSSMLDPHNPCQHSPPVLYKRIQ